MNQEVIKKVSQKDAVFNIASQVLGIIQEPGKESLNKATLDKSVKKQIKEKLVSAIVSGEIKLNKTFDDKKLSKYCSGLISNWLTKDSRYI